jgi:outer membrane lipoprotein-sorting protein
MTTLITMILLASPGVEPKIQDYVQKGFKDASMSGKIEVMKQSELVKIKRDFANNYRINGAKLFLKEPHMIRIEAKLQDTDVLFVQNGVKRLAKIPRAGINSKESFDKAPGKRTTVLDFGLVTPSMFDDPFNPKFVRTDRESGDQVFDLFYTPRYDDTARNRIWIDAEKKLLTRREWYSQEGRHLATFLYQEPKSENGGWIATKVTVLNSEGKIAGITRYTSSTINTGIAASLFAIK